jgi:hypothetical protein
MPCTMPSPCHSIAPALSGHSHHVYWIVLTSLITLVPSLAGDRHANAQLWTRPDAPTTPRSCQSAHEHVSGHDRAHARPIASVLPSSSPFARAHTYAPASSWTTLLARGNALAIAMIRSLPPSTVLVVEATRAIPSSPGRASYPQSLA